MKKGLVIVALLFLLVFSVAAYSQTRQSAEDAITSAKQDIQELKNANFSTVRVNDLLGEAEKLYESQVALEDQDKTPAYSFVIEKTNYIAGIRSIAFETSDSLKALELAIQDLDSNRVNMSPVNELYAQANGAFVKERYEESFDLIEDTYDKISEVEAASSRVRAFYTAGTKTVKGFVLLHWKGLSIFIVLLIFGIITLKDPIAIRLIELRIERLELEKKTLFKLIKEVQYEYFQNQKMSESEYTIKIKKFKEIIRDINRQIPLLKTEIETKKKNRFKFGKARGAPKAKSWLIEKAGKKPHSAEIKKQ